MYSQGYYCSLMRRNGIETGHNLPDLIDGHNKNFKIILVKEILSILQICQNYEIYEFK